jgi:hypothetical protein
VSFPRLIVQEVFEISGRGLAVLFSGDLPPRRVGLAFPVKVLRRDGSFFEAPALLEWVLDRQPETRERAALVLAGVTRDDVPPGSAIEVL